MNANICAIQMVTLKMMQNCKFSRFLTKLDLILIFINEYKQRPIPVGDWFSLANRGIKQSIDLKRKSDELKRFIIDLINNISIQMSQQFLETHKVASDQVESALKTQSNLINTQYDVNLTILYIFYKFIKLTIIFIFF